jgi:GT2 family glycosyltransferase
MNLPSDGIFLGANWACPKRYLWDLGGFDEGLGLNSKGEGAEVGEETDLMKRLDKRGLNGWYSPDTKVYHFVGKKKCQIEHVVSRQLEVRETRYENKNINEFLGLPVGLLKEKIKNFIKYQHKKLLNKKWKKDYLEYKFWKKRMKESKGELM